MRLLSKGKKSNSVVTRFSLRKATNANGITFSQAQFTVDRDLSPEEFNLINSLSEQVKALSTRVGHDTEPAGEDIPQNVDLETGEVIAPLE
jgi:hypothetical protein